jgi:hypothetical protein
VFPVRYGQTYRSHYFRFDNASNIRRKEKLYTPLCNILAKEQEETKAKREEVISGYKKKIC